MIVNRFLEEDLDNLMLFLDDNITENYEKGVFLTIMKRLKNIILFINARV